MTQPLFGFTTTGKATLVVGADDLMANTENLVIDLFENNIIRAAEFSAQDATDTIKSLEVKNVYNDDDLAGNNENKFTEATSPVLPAAILETLDIEYTHAPLTIESVEVGNILTDGSIRIVSGDGVLTKSADDTVVEDTYINDIANAVITGSPVGKTVTGEFESDRWIQLADDMLDVFNINGDVSFKSNFGYLIEVGTIITADPTSPMPTLATRGTDSGATVNLGAVNFNAQSGSLMGHVTLVEDSDIEVYGSNAADTLFLRSPLNNISDRDNTQIDVNGLAVFLANSNITLADHADDVLDVTGNTTFLASDILDAIDVGVTPQSNPLHTDRGFDSGAIVLLSSVHFTGFSIGAENVDPTLNIGKVTIYDDTDSVLDHSNTLLFDLLPFTNYFIRSVVFNSGGSITDAIGTYVFDTGMVAADAFAHFSAASHITLADNSTDIIIVTGNAFFESRTGQAIDVGVTPTTQLAADRGKDSGALVDLGNLTFSSQNGTNGDVTIREDMSTELAHTHLDDSNKADSLVLVSAGHLSDAAKVAPNTATSINVTSFAEFNAAGNVILADNADDQLTVGGNALFSSSNSEFFPAFIGDFRINVGVVDLDTTIMPTDASRGTDSGATVELGSVTFSGREPDGFAGVDTHVTIREDNAMELSNSTRSVHKNVAETAFLVTSGALTDASDTDVTLEDFGVMIAESSITLANHANDSISIANNATFGTFTGSAIDVGVTPTSQLNVARGTDSNATVNFGSLHYTSKANSADVTIHEDSNTLFDRGAFSSFETLDLTTYFAKSSSVTSAGTITDSKGTEFNNTAFAEFIAQGADAGTNQSITLADSATDKMSIAGNALFESTAGGDIEVGVVPTATGGALIDTTATRGTDSSAAVNFGSLTTNSESNVSNVTVREDSDMVLSNSKRLGHVIDAGSLFFVAANGAGILDPTGNATISDAKGTSINSIDLAVFRTDDSITLADEKADSFTVGANATFYTTELVSIDVGVTPQANPLDVNRGTDSGANVTFGSVHFTTSTLLLDNPDPKLNTGGVTIYEDNDSLLDNTNSLFFDMLISGDYYARSIVFSSAGNITDAENTDLSTSGIIADDSFAHFSANHKITLANNADDKFSVIGNAFFESKTGQQINVGVDPTIPTNDITRGKDSDAIVGFGSLTVATSGEDGHVTINEDNATIFDNAQTFNIHNGNTSVALSLTLHTDGSITDADTMTSLIVKDLAHFEALGFDLVLGDSLVVNKVDLSELFFIADDVSIVEQSDITSDDDKGLYLYDGSVANNQIAIETGGHLIQVNDARTDAVITFGEKVSAENGLFRAKGAVVLTNIEFANLAAHAENTVIVAAGQSLDTTDPIVMGGLTTDALPSFLPTSDSDTFAPPAPAPTDGTSAADAASNISLSGHYSIVLEQHGDLTITNVLDMVGSVSKLNPLNGIETTGNSSGHIFLETLKGNTAGDLTFDSTGSAVDIANQKVFTALAAGDLTIVPTTTLVSHVNGTLNEVIASNFPGPQPFGPDLTNTVGATGSVSTISAYNDLSPAPFASQGPSYAPNADSLGIVQAISSGAPLGFQADISIDTLGATDEFNNRLEFLWDDGNSDVYLLQDGIDSKTTFNHYYTPNFPGQNSNQAFITVNAYNDPLINLFDEVTSMASKNAQGVLTEAEDLNFVTDTVKVTFIPLELNPFLPPAFVKPTSPDSEISLIPEQRADPVSSLVEYADDPTVLLQVQDVSSRKYNEITMEFGDKKTLTGKNLFTLEQVKAYIYEEPTFLPGEYEITILLAGQQEPIVDTYIKPDASSSDADMPDGASNTSLEYFKQLSNSQKIDRSTDTAEQVWEQQYEQWFPAVSIQNLDEKSAQIDSKVHAEGSDITDDVSDYLQEQLLESPQQAQEALELDNDLRLGESWKSRNRSHLAMGMGGAMIMGMYAINTQAQDERREAVKETLSSEKTKIGFSKGARLRERLKRMF
ncbi:MAG: beta strand repeat-containing protein [Pirellulales bacterium]